MRNEPIPGHRSVGKATVLGVDTDGGPWAVICENHSTVVNVDTARTARSTYTREFCEECRDERVTLTKRSRVDSVTGQRIDGPTHVVRYGGLTLCGRRISQYLGTEEYGGTLADVTCAACLTGEPKAWRAAR